MKEDYNRRGVPQEKPTSMRPEKVLRNVIRTISVDFGRFVPADNAPSSDMTGYLVTDIGLPDEEIVLFQATSDLVQHGVVQNSTDMRGVSLMGGVIFGPSEENDVVLLLEERRTSKKRAVRDPIAWWLQDLNLPLLGDPDTFHRLNELVKIKAEYHQHRHDPAFQLPGKVAFRESAQPIVDRLRAGMTPEQAAIAFPA